MPLHFDSVEIIELPFVAGPNHPSQRFNASIILDEDEELDSASVTLGWKPSSRTRINFEEYEEDRAKKVKRKGKRGKLRKLTRAVKKRVLRQNGVETSDIESEDERPSSRKSKKKKKRKKSKMRIPGKKAVMNRFRSQDRFAAESSSTDAAPGRPCRPGATRQDSLPQRPTRCPFSPAVVSDDEGPEYPDHTSSHNAALAPPKLPNRVQSPPTANLFSPEEHRTGRRGSLHHINAALAPPKLPNRVQSPPTANLFSPEEHRTGRRGSLHHITDAMTTLAKQPVKLAKQPVKLAKKTKKKIKKVLWSYSGEQQPVTAQAVADQPQRRSSLPTLPPVYIPGDASYEDDDLLENFCEKDSSNESVLVPDIRAPKLVHEDDKEDIRSVEHRNVEDPIAADQKADHVSSDDKYHERSPKASPRGRGILVRSKSSQMEECTPKPVDGWSANLVTPPSTRFLPTVEDIFSGENLSCHTARSSSASLTQEDVDDITDMYRTYASPTKTSSPPAVSEKSHHLDDIGHMANAIGTLASQPVRLPFKLVKSTHTQLKKSRRGPPSPSQLAYDVDEDDHQPDSLHNSPACSDKYRYQSTNTMETSFDFWSSDDDEMDLNDGGAVDIDSDSDEDEDQIHALKERRASQLLRRRSSRSFVCQTLDETIAIVDAFPSPQRRRRSLGSSRHSRGSSGHSRGGSRRSRGSSGHSRGNRRGIRRSRSSEHSR